MMLRSFALSLATMLTLGNNHLRMFSWVGGAFDLGESKRIAWRDLDACLSRPLLKKNVKNLFRPEIRQDYPPNLSILISGGKENNSDALSNGE
jgi:hypothetical protein